MFIPGIRQAKTNLEFAYQGQSFSTGFYTLRTNPYSQGELDALVDTVLDWTIEALLPFLSTEVSLQGITAYAMDAIDAPKSGTSLALPIPGGESGSIAPLNVSMVVTLDSGGRGRSARGRMYVAGFNENRVTGTRWSADYVTAVQGAVGTLRTGLAASGDVMIVSGKQLDGVLLTSRTARVVTTIRAKAVVGTQRKRIDYGTGN